jgi:hypothetical protein
VIWASWPRTSTANRFVGVAGVEEIVIGFSIWAILAILAILALLAVFSAAT